MTDGQAPPLADDRTLVAGLQLAVQSMLRQVLDGATEVALVDFPYHRNAGDAAIWAGERAVLQSLGVRVRYVADAGRFNAARLREAVPDGPVLLSGGGNVGDLWPWSQALRERVLRELPGRPVVQLAQSVHFQTRAQALAFAGVVRRHGAYTFVARDPASAERAATLDPAAILLAPDMAFGLGSLERPRRSARGVLALARDDLEGTSGLVDGTTAPIDVVDWSLGGWGALRWQVTRCAPRAGRLAVGSRTLWRATAPVMTAALESMCRQVLDRGVRLLSGAEVVITDRLHAHILCVLLGLPHVVLDNSYGKIRALHEHWTSSSATTWWADDLKSAVQTAHRLRTPSDAA